MSQPRRLPLVMYAAAMGMEMCYLYVGLDSLRPGLPPNSVSFFLLLALYPAASLARAVAMSPRFARRSFAFSVGLGIAMVCAVIILTIWQILVADYPVGAAVLPVGFSGLAWWLGSSLIRDEVSYPYICTRFQIGIFVLLLLIAFAQTLIPIILFFTLAVVALALARWETSLTDSRGILRPYLPGAIILGIAAVLVPGAAILLVLSPDVVQVIRRWLATLGRILQVDRPPPSSSQIPWEFSCSFQPAKEEAALPSPPPATDTPTSPVIFWFILFAAFLAVLFLVPFTIRQLKARRRAYAASIAGVETTSLPVSLLRQLASVIKGISRWLWHWVLFMFRLRHIPGAGREDEAVLSTRALYRSLLRWAAGHGLPRAQSQTPWEYLRLLCQKFPQSEQELALITKVYVTARYGRSPTSSQGFDTAMTAWQKVKSIV